MHSAAQIGANKKIIKLVYLKKLLRSDMWMVVEGLYNKWARKHSFLHCDS